MKYESHVVCIEFVVRWCASRLLVICRRCFGKYRVQWCATFSFVFLALVCAVNSMTECGSVWSPRRSKWVLDRVVKMCGFRSDCNLADPYEDSGHASRASVRNATRSWSTSSKFPRSSGVTCLRRTGFFRVSDRSGSILLDVWRHTNRIRTEECHAVHQNLHAVIRGQCRRCMFRTLLYTELSKNYRHERYVRETLSGTCAVEDDVRDVLRHQMNTRLNTVSFGRLLAQHAVGGCLSFWNSERTLRTAHGMLIFSIPWRTGFV